MSAQPLWGNPIFVPNQILTKEDMEKLPKDGSKYELYQGVLIQMPPPRYRHGNIASRIVHHLFVYLEQLGREECVSDAAGFDLTIAGERDTILAPDVVVVQDDIEPENGYMTQPPLLAVEVVSPSQFRPEMAMKARFYLAAGVKLVWVVWPNTRTIEVWTPVEQVITLQEADTITGGDILPGFTCQVAKFFPPKKA